MNRLGEVKGSRIRELGVGCEVVVTNTNVDA